MLHERIYELTGQGSGNINANNSNARSPAPGQLVKRRSKLGFTDKKIADDEFMAAAIGDTEWLRQSLRNNRGAINFDKNGLAPIHLASIHGRLDCLKLLVDKLKLDVNMASSTGWRPVHLAISNQTGRRSFSCLSYLLSKGGDPSVANDDGITPMHQAASEGHVQCMKALIEAGAQIDGEDCRGHKPLDLAKLWGHKKCARILAAEMWHRDKDFIAREMRQLEKVKMQQVLHEIEMDEEHRADQQFYGDLAFNQWLDARNLPSRPTGPPSLVHKDDPHKDDPHKDAGTKGILKGQTKVKKQASTPRKVDSLSKPNSMRAPVGKIGEAGKDTGKAKEDEGRSAAEEDPRQRVSEVKFIEPVMEEEDGDDAKETDAAGEKAKTMFVNPISWNKSPKISPAEYVQLLPDHYPRDVYTMLPKHAPTRARPPQEARDTGPTSSAATSSRVESSVRMPKLPADVIERALNVTKRDRTVVYKCKNIMDVQRRQHYDPDDGMIAKPEIGLHLTNQLNSRIFQTALQPERIPNTPSTVISGISTPPSTGSNTGRSGANLHQSVKVDLSRVANAVQNSRLSGAAASRAEIKPLSTIPHAQITV